MYDVDKIIEIVGSLNQKTLAGIENENSRADVKRYLKRIREFIMLDSFNGNDEEITFSIDPVMEKCSDDEYIVKYKPYIRVRGVDGLLLSSSSYNAEDDTELNCFITKYLEIVKLRKN